MPGGCPRRSPAKSRPHSLEGRSRRTAPPASGIEGCPSCDEGSLPGGSTTLPTQPGTVNSTTSSYASATASAAPTCGAACVTTSAPSSAQSAAKTADNWPNTQAAAPPTACPTRGPSPPNRSWPGHRSRGSTAPAGPRSPGRTAPRGHSRPCAGPGSAAELITASPSEAPRRCEDQPMDGLVQFLRDLTLRVRTPSIPPRCWSVAWCRSGK